MSTKILLLVALLLSVAIQMRHETSHIEFAHLQDDDSQKQEKDDLIYLAALKAQQKKIDDAIKKLQQVNNQVQDTLDQIEGVPQLKAIALAEGLADEREVIVDLENKTSLPWEYKTIDCKNFTDEQYQDLDKTITALENTLSEIGDLLDEAAPEGNNTRDDELQKEYDIADTYLKEMRETAQTRCPVPEEEGNQGVQNVTQHANISNLENTPWVIGEDYTLSDYLNELVFQNLGKDVVRCPTETPFVEFNTTECVACEQGEYFDLEFRECSPCPQDTVYTQKLKHCMSARVEELLNCSQCSPGEVFNLETFECSCPDDKPYKDENDTCTSCFYPRYYNNKTELCEGCPLGLYYDTTLGDCTICDEETPLVTLAGECVACPQGQFYIKQLNKCDKDGCGPSCKACVWPGIYDIATGRCLTCPGQTTFNFQKRGCICPLGTKYDDETETCQSDILDIIKPAELTNLTEQDNITVIGKTKTSVILLPQVDNTTEESTEIDAECDPTEIELTPSTFRYINKNGYYLNPHDGECPPNSFGCDNRCYCNYGFIPRSNGNLFYCYDCEGNGYSYSDKYYTCARVTDIDVTPIVVNTSVCEYTRYGLSEQTYDYITQNKYWISQDEEGDCPQNTFKCHKHCYCDYGYIPRSQNGRTYCFNCEEHGYKFSEKYYTCARVTNKTVIEEATESESTVSLFAACQAETHGLTSELFYRIREGEYYFSAQNDRCPQHAFRCQDSCYCRHGYIPRKTEGVYSCFHCQSRGYTFDVDEYTCKKKVENVDVIGAHSRESTQTQQATEEETEVIGGSCAQYHQYGYSASAFRQLRELGYSLNPDEQSKCAEDAFLCDDKCYCKYGSIPYTKDQEEYYCLDCEENGLTFSSQKYVCVKRVELEGVVLADYGYDEDSFKLLQSKRVYLRPDEEGNCVEDSFRIENRCYCKYGSIPYSDNDQDYYCYDCEEHGHQFNRREFHCESEREESHHRHKLS